MTLPQTQKALVIPTERAPWELRTDWPVPAPGPKEVLVKVVAAALNPIDWKIQSRGVFFVKDYPYNGGMDGAGIVEAVGEGVTTLTKGDKMYVSLLRGACACADADMLSASFRVGLPLTIRPSGSTACVPRIIQQRCVSC